MNSVVAVPDLLGTCPADLLPDGDVPQSTADEARARAKRIRAGLADYTRMRQDIADARARRDWISLGYSAWFEYVETEYGEALRQLGRGDRQEAVRDLRKQGASTRQIAAAVGVDAKTVRNDLAQVGTDSPPAEVTGRDGKTYAATRPSTPDPTFVLKYSASAGCWLIGPLGGLPFASDDDGIDALDVAAAQAWAAAQTAYVERREVIRWRESPDTDGAWIAVLSEDVPANPPPAPASPGSGTTRPDAPAPDSRPVAVEAGSPTRGSWAGEPHNVPAGHHGGQPTPTPAPPPAGRAAPISPARGTEEVTVGEGSPTEIPRPVGEPEQPEPALTPAERIAAVAQLAPEFVKPTADWRDSPFAASQAIQAEKPTPADTRQWWLWWAEDITQPLQDVDPDVLAATLDEQGWQHAAEVRDRLTIWFERLFAHRA